MPWGAVTIFHNGNDTDFLAVGATPSTSNRFKSSMPSTSDLFRQLGIVGESTRRFVLAN